MRTQRISDHPLLLYPVTQCILKNLNFRELLLIRQVCLPWKSQADLLLKDRTKIVIKGSTKLRKILKSLRYLSSSETLITTNFVLESVELGDAVNFFFHLGSEIKFLTLNFCVWSSVFLNEIIFEALPNLVFLSLITNHNPMEGSETLLPMSLDHCCKKKPVLKLKALEITGDFSHRTDVLYRILRCSPQLECIKQSKHFGQQDGLFGTWFFEILLSCKFQYLKCLELDCSIIQQQCQQFSGKEFPLVRLHITVADVKIQTIKNLIDSFNRLTSVEIGIKYKAEDIGNRILASYKSKPDFWIVVYDSNKDRLVFPRHEYVF